MASSKKRVGNPSNILLAACLSCLGVVVSIILLTSESLGLDGNGLLGIPVKRLAILLILAVMGFILILVGVRSSRKYQRLDLWFHSISVRGRSLLKILAIILILWGIVSFLVPDQFFGSLKGYFWLQRFLSIPVAFAAFITWIMIWFEGRKTEIASDIKALIRPVLLPFSLTSGFLLLLAVLIYLTKIGLVCDTGYWNVPGIPVSGLQTLTVLVFLSVILLVKTWFFRVKHEKAEKVFGILLPILIYAAALLVWGFTPMFKHHFSLEPALPNFQPYPASDARIHDLGAISILKGYGIFFHGFTDKPLYMVYLAILHLIAKNDYSLITWLQLLLLSLIPVVLFMVGKKYRDSIFGLALAAVMIIQQRNAIFLSHKIASANVKLFITEGITLLGILLCVYLLFQWMRTGKYSTAVLLGGLIGAMSLVRLNPLIFIPLVAIIGIIKFRKSRGACVKQLALCATGFLLVFTPWIVTGVDANNTPWMIIKFNSILKDRIEPMINTSIFQNDEIIEENIELIKNNNQLNTYIQFFENTENQRVLTSGFDLVISLNEKNDSKVGSFTYLLLNHFLHNFSTSFLALPDAQLFDNLETIQQREYYRDINQWNGTFSFSQSILVIINLVLFSIGIAACWKRNKWIGLIPIIIFFTYDGSLSFAMNSGSRYIVPINWVIFFYYLFGIYSLLSVICRLLVPENEPQNEKVLSFVKNSKRQKLWPSFLPLILIASLIPISNLLVPETVNHQKPQINTPLNVETMCRDTNNNQVWIGEIFYPYYQIYGGSIMFDFLVDQSISSHIIDKNNIIDPIFFMADQQPAILCLSPNGEKMEIYQLFLLINGNWNLFWDNRN